MVLTFDETVKELWKIIDLSKTGSKIKAKSINLMLSVTKERYSILKKEIDIIKTKPYKNLVDEGSNIHFRQTSVILDGIAVQ